MAQARPTLIDLPDPPSHPDTPQDMPGTPNSTTTSLSVLSTTAIKDGHRGTSHPTATTTLTSHFHSANLEAERADRISRLAGLERISHISAPGFAGARIPLNAASGPGGQGGFVASAPSYSGAGFATHGPSTGGSGGAGTAVPSGFYAGTTPGALAGQIPGYFDTNGNPVYGLAAQKQISTVGSASATGSISGTRTTTWASGSVGGPGSAAGDGSIAGELMGDGSQAGVYGEGNYSSGYGMDADTPMGDSASVMGGSVDGEGDRMSDGSASLVGWGEGAGSTVSGPISAEKMDGRAMDMRTGGYRLGDHNTTRSDSPSATVAAERIMRERFGERADLESKSGGRVMGRPSGEQDVGKFYFEDTR